MVVADDEKEAFTAWIAAKNDATLTRAVSAKVVEVFEGKDSAYAKDILSLKQFLAKRSIWVFGGDGWAYDIGFGGLDHVLASGQDVNVLVLDTEVYSNTGGTGFQVDTSRSSCQICSIR